MKTNQNNKLRKFLYLAILIYGGTAIYAFIYNYRMNDMRGIGMGVVALLTPWLIPALFKIVKLKASDEIYILNIILNNYDEDATILISTHLIADIENILDQVVFIKEGQIVLNSSVEGIREKQGKSVDSLFREVFKC